MNTHCFWRGSILVAFILATFALFISTFTYAQTPDVNGFIGDDPTDIDRPLTELEKVDVTFCGDTYTDKVMVEARNIPPEINAGNRLSFEGVVLNMYPFPIVDAVLKAKVIQVIAPTDTLPVEHYALLEEVIIMDAITLRERGEGSFMAPWTVPNAPEGQYRIVFFITTKEGNDISGISSSHQIGAGSADFVIKNSGTPSVTPTSAIQAPAPKAHWSKFPSIATYPIVRGGENSFFTCVGFDSSTTTSYKAVLTLKDTRGATIKEATYTQGQGEDGALKALVARFIPESDYASFSITFDVYANDTLLEHTEAMYKCEDLGACAPAPVSAIPVPESSSMTFTDIIQIILLTISIFAILTALYKYVKEKQHLEIPTLIILGLYLASGLVYMTVMTTEYTNAALATKYSPSTYTPYGYVNGTCPSTSYYKTAYESCSFDGYQYYCPSLGYISSLPVSCTTVYGEWGPEYTCPVTTTVVNGTFTNLGVHNRCVLTGIGGDWEDIRSCFLTGTQGGNWSMRATDEGGKYAFLCYTLCSDVNAAGTPYGYGATCKVGGTSGVMNSSNLCCTGTYYDAGCPYYNVSHNMYCSTPNAPQISSFTGTNGAQTGASLTNLTTGSTVTLNWSVNSDVVYCSASGAGDWTGEVSRTGGSQAVTVNANTTYTLTCKGYQGTDVIQTVTATVLPPPLPDLISQSLTISPNPIYANQQITLNAYVRNIGTASTPPADTPFYDDFTYQWNGVAGAWSQISQHIHQTGIVAGATIGPDIASFTPLQAGTLYIQHCVDSNNDIDEGLAAEAPNCTVGSGITVREVPTGDLSVSDDSINGGDTITLSWNTTANAAASCTVTNGIGDTWSGISGSQQSSQLYSDQTYTLSCDGFLIDSVSIDVVTTPELTIDSAVVNQGDSVTFTWNTHNGDEGLCKLKNYDGAPNRIVVGGDPNIGSATVQVNARSKYTLTCPVSTGIDEAVSVSVEIVPRIYEL